MISLMSPAATPAAWTTARNPSMTPRSGAVWVVSTLAVVRLPPASSARSVKVPPISTARRADFIRLLGSGGTVCEGWRVEPSGNRSRFLHTKPRSGQNPKILGRDNTEVIRYLITIDVPFSGHLLAQER